MNFAILGSVRVISPASTDKIISEIKQLVRQLRLHGLVEIAFYVSEDQSQEILINSFWWQMQDLKEANELINLALFKKLEGRAEILEPYIFQLVWEYRRFLMPIQASVVRLLTLPENYPEEYVNKNMSRTRQYVEKDPDILAAWNGRSIDSGKHILFRTDWGSLQAQQVYFKSESVQNTIRTLRAEGIILNYASFNLQSIIKPEEF